MVTLLLPGNIILMLPGCLKKNSSISDFVARGRTESSGNSLSMPECGHRIVLIRGPINHTSKVECTLFERIIHSFIRSFIYPIPVATLKEEGCGFFFNCSRNFLAVDITDRSTSISLKCTKQAIYLIMI